MDFTNISNLILGFNVYFSIEESDNNVPINIDLLKVVNFILSFASLEMNFVSYLDILYSLSQNF